MRKGNYWRFSTRDTGLEFRFVRLMKGRDGE